MNELELRIQWVIHKKLDDLIADDLIKPIMKAALAQILAAEVGKDIRTWRTWQQPLTQQHAATWDATWETCPSCPAPVMPDQEHKCLTKGNDQCESNSSNTTLTEQENQSTSSAELTET